MARALEGYNGVAATYFIRFQQDHNILKLGNLIAQADGKARVKKIINIDGDLDVSSRQHVCP
jgi:hypothetical protein